MENILVFSRLLLALFFLLTGLGILADCSESRRMSEFGSPAYRADVLAGIVATAEVTIGIARNYLIGHAELGLDLRPAMRHVMQYLPSTEVEAIAEEALGVSWKASH